MKGGDKQAHAVLYGEICNSHLRFLTKRSQGLAQLLLPVHQGSSAVYAGCAQPLYKAMEDRRVIWDNTARKFRTITETVAELYRRGFTQSQVDVVAIFFKLRVVFRTRPTELLYGKSGLWNVEVDEADNAPHNWVNVCENLSSSPWVTDSELLTSLDQIMTNAIGELCNGDSRNSLMLLKGIENGDQSLISRIIMDAQIPVRVAMVRLLNGNLSPFLSDDDREQHFDGIKLVSILCITEGNPLHNATNIPKRLYPEKHADGGNPFLECVVQFALPNLEAGESRVCLELGFAFYIFGKQPDFLNLFNSAPFK